MNVDTGAFKALTAEVERMAGLVDTLAQKFEAMSTRALGAEIIYEAGRHDERMAILGGSEGRARRPNRHGRAGSGYLSAVPDGRTS